jgi:predicted HicB family RNase H-like nuclease
MTYKGYQAKVELDERAGVFHGEVITTRGHYFSGFFRGRIETGL